MKSFSLNSSIKEAKSEKKRVEKGKIGQFQVKNGSVLQKLFI